MAGIYIHIPFCKKACHYCNFHFSTSLTLKEQLIHCLIKELELQKNYLIDPIETIYFGGGTPSLLTISEIEAILKAIYSNFKIEDNVEITLEANPDDISEIKLNEYKLKGITRFSLGVQSFIDRDLLWMNRTHNATQSIHSIELIKKAGFNNFSIDLIYGSSELTNEEWISNIQLTLKNNIPHISAYALTVEPKTALESFINKNKSKPIHLEKQAEQFEILMELLKEEGFEHYEISNFAKPGFRSKHNSSYWKRKQYLGIGPSAHSYNKKSRQWNIANNALYIKSLEKNIIPFEQEILTTTQQINEYIMISLRTMEGCSLQYINEEFGEIFFLQMNENAKKYIQQHLIEKHNDLLILTAKGKLLADKISADLFFEEN